MAVVMLNAPLQIQFNIIHNIKTLCLVKQVVLQTKKNTSKEMHKAYLTPDTSPLFSCLGDE